MCKLSVTLVGAALLVIGISGAWGANDSSATQAVEKDFGKLSEDGVSAFNDIHLARIDLFNGKTNEAAKLVSDALASLLQAKRVNAAFMKAESELHPPPQAPVPGDHTRSATPIAWLPIDGEISTDETYKLAPEKAAAVVDANKSLEKGDGAKALETIRVAAVDVNYIAALAPLEQSIVQVTQADRLMASHDYYGAGQALRVAEAGIRYDEIDDIAHVRAHARAGAP